MKGNIIRYLGKEVRGLRTQGLYPVLSYSSRGLPKVVSDTLEIVEVSNFEYLEKSQTESLKEPFDNVNVPFHYASTSIECIDAMEAAFGKEFIQHFCIGNAFKYLWRYDKKGKPIEDIQKCKRYLEMFLKSISDEDEKDKCTAVCT